MSFHPADALRRGLAQVERTLPSRGRRSRSPRRTAPRFEEIASHYPPERRKSAVLAALYLVQEQQGHITGK